MSLGSNGVNQVCSLRKIPTWHRGTNFCINRTSSACIELSFVRRQNGPKGTKIIRNSPKHEFRVPWGGSGVFIAKNSDATSWHEHLHWLHQFFPFWTEYHKMTKWSQMHPKHYETHQNISLGYNGVDWMQSVWNIPARLRGTNFCIDCTSWGHFESSFVRWRNAPKCTQTRV